MAKTSKIVRNAKRRAVVAAYAERRAHLKRVSVAPHASPRERADAMHALHRLPRDASPTRVGNRDVVDGRPRAVYRRFGLSRIRLRTMVLNGELPGMTKASW